MVYTFNGQYQSGGLVSGWLLLCCLSVCLRARSRACLPLSVPAAPPLCLNARQSGGLVRLLLDPNMLAGVRACRCRCLRPASLLSNCSCLPPPPSTLVYLPRRCACRPSTRP